MNDGRTVTAVIEQSLRETLARQDEGIGPADFVVEPFDGSGLMPGVDLTDSSALLDAMER